MLVPCYSFPDFVQPQKMIKDHSLKRLQLERGQGYGPVCLEILQIQPASHWNEEQFGLLPARSDNPQLQAAQAQLAEDWRQNSLAFLHHYYLSFELMVCQLTFQSFLEFMFELVNYYIFIQTLQNGTQLWSLVESERLKKSPILVMLLYLKKSLNSLFEKPNFATICKLIIRSRFLFLRSYCSKI